MRKSALLLSAALILVPAPLFAQQADPGQPTEPTGPSGAGEIDQANTAGPAAVENTDLSEEPVDSSDIVVTATRRNQALSDVPLAVSAVTAENLQLSGATDIRQLNQLSPSLLVFSTQSEAGAAVARIRGIGTVGDNPGLESSVGVFIDGVYRSRTGMGLTELGPLERIEVLRGPQGTLFGRNTSAGLISVITAQPRFEPNFGGALTVGNYNLRRGEATATGPLSSSLAARVDAVYMKRDGLLNDVISGRDVNDRNRFLVRGQILYQPTDAFTLRFVGDVTRRREECCAAVYLPARDFTAAGGSLPSTTKAVLGALGAVINDDPYDRDVSITPGRNFDSDVDDWGLSNEIVWNLGPNTLTSITAYRYNDLERGQDIDYNNLDLFYRTSGGGSGNRFKTFTQELRFQGEAMAGRLDWLVGGYFANEKLRAVDNVAYGADLPRYGNCLVAANFAANPAIGPSILAPGVSPTCFNPTVAAGVLPFLDPATAGVLSAFARLGAFAGAPFTNSGFSNLAIALGGAPFIGSSLAGRQLNDEWNQTSNNWALFTHNIFEITRGLDLTVGARYTHEKKTARANLSDNNNLCSFFSAAIPSLQLLPCVFVPSTPGGSFQEEDSLSENKLTGTAVLSYKATDQLMTYASYSRGYKAGGFNLDRAALLRSNGSGAILPQDNLDALKFKPETVDALELGAKYNGTGFDINVALFHQLFKNYQLNTFNGANFVVENINSCKDDLNGADADNSPLTGACTGGTRAGVRSRGIEIEAFTRPMRFLDVNAGVTYADTKYRNNLVGANGKPLTNALFQLPGRRLSNSNKWTLTGAVAWTPPIGGTGLSAIVYADARHMSGFNTGSDLDLEKYQKAFTVVNGRVGVRGPNNNWAVELWAQNLFNADYMQVAFDAPVQPGGVTNTERGVLAGFTPRATQLFGAFLGEPRTFGLTLRANFSPRSAPPALIAPAPLPPPPAAMQTCPDGTVIAATSVCPLPPPPPAPASGERG